MTTSVMNRIRPYLQNIDKNECILYKRLGRDGYGIIQEVVDGYKLHHRAHRVAYMYYYNRTIPEGKVIMHSCDVPACVNPFHLSVGTHNDNCQDKVNKLRQAKGKQNGRYVHGHYSKFDYVPKVIEFQSICNRKLSREDAIEIKRLLATKEKKIKDIAIQFNVKDTVIKDISAGRTYQSV
jgi:hypothetical protein